MKCNSCDTEMEEGLASLDSTFWGTVFFGFSYQHLFFRRGKEKRQKIFDDGSTKHTFLCPKCGDVYIVNREYDSYQVEDYIREIDEDEDPSKIVI